MAISSSTRKAGPFIGNDATTVFPFAFKVFTAADLRVVNTSALGIESDLVIDVDYTVSLNADQDNDPGGSVTRLTALPTGQRLTITSDVEALQPLVLTNNGGFYPRVINDAFDKITIIAQQLIEQVGRSLKLPISSSASATLPDPVANRLIAWNSSANGFANIDPASLATVAAYADAKLELFNGNGTQTAFTLTEDPAVLANLDVSISGVTQVGGEDFTWIGTTLTFLVAPPNGTRIQVRYTRAIPPADLATAVAAAEADRVATAADRVATAADRVQTGLDRVQTGLDRVATAADVVSAEADRVATAADRVQTGLDAVATAADRVQTGLDVAATSNKQPLDADLTAIANLTSAADKMPYATGAQTWALADLTSFARTLLATASNSAFLTALGQIASSAINFLQAGTGAVTRTGQAKLRDTVSVLDFGAVGDGATNNDVAFAAARAYCATLSAAGNAIRLVFPAGRYVYSASENWAIIRLHLDFQGEVWMICTGTGTNHGFVLDGGSSGSGVYGMQITGDPQIYAASGGFHGVYMRALFDCSMQINCRSSGAGNVGFYGEWLVDNDLFLTMSGVEGGLNGGVPATGMWLTTRGVGEDSSYNRITTRISGNPSPKMARGIFLDAALGNEIKGTVQNCTLGLETTVNAWENKLLNMDFEANTLDIKDLSRRLDINGCDCETEVEFWSGALGSRIRGGRVNSIEIKSGAVGVQLDTSWNLSSGSITNAGTRTRIDALWDLTNQVYTNPVKTATVLSPTVTTFAYTNNTGAPVQVSVYGGTVTGIIFSHAGGYYTGATQGLFTLPVGSTLTVENTVVPQMVVFA